MRTDRKEMFLTKKCDYLSFIFCFTVTRLIAGSGHPYLAGGVLMFEGIFLYVLNYRRTSSLVDIRGLFSLSWVSGIGLACLKLSSLQREWENMTWLCFFCAYFFFMIGNDFMKKLRPDFAEKRTEEKAVERNERKASRIMICILVLGGVSVGCFLLEAVIVGFIPLFSPEPHAYSYFHVSGVHYFTISCILIPALTVLYTKVVEHWQNRNVIFSIVGNVIAVAIPILCVSRFQLLFAVGFAAVTYLMLYRKITWKMIVGAIVVLIPVYVLLTVARRHDVAYLNGIFEMKNRNTPIFVTQPYMYVVNNFENFNCLVSELTSHTYGLKMLFPVFALTGLKFVVPELVSFPLYITKKELTTLTMFYDAYYDFGLIGVIVFAAVLGVLAAVITGKLKPGKNPASYLFYGQIAIYFGLSFFTTWFSNPTTWFWLGITLVMYLFIGFERKAKTCVQNIEE